MKVIEKTPLRLTLRTYPWNTSIIGFIWIAIGIYFSINAQLSVRFVGGLSFFLGCLYFLFAAHIETCYFDKTLGLITLTIQGLYMNKIIEVPLRSIVRVEVETYKLRHHGHTHLGYRTVMIKKNRGSLPLTINYNSSQKTVQKTAKIIREFLQLEAT